MNFSPKIGLGASSQNITLKSTLVHKLVLSHFLLKVFLL